MQRNTLTAAADVAFVCPFVMLSSLFLMGLYEDFLFKLGDEVAQQL